MGGVMIATIFDVLTAPLAVLAFFFGVYQYYIARKWKILEFVAKKVDEFEEDPIVSDVFLMLDWVAIKLHFHISDSSPKFTVSHRKIVEALRSYNVGESNFTEEEEFIRRSFDHFLNKIGKFENFVEAGLIEKKHLDPYLKYWMLALQGKGKVVDQSTANAISNFIDEFDYASVRRLIRRYADE